MSDTPVPPFLPQVARRDDGGSDPLVSDRWT